MTITINELRNEYTATSGQTVFPYTFKIFESTDLNVYQTPAGSDFDCAADLITAYTVSGVGDEDGGNVTLTTGATTGDRITIVSNIPASRTTDYQNNGDFRPATVNADFDRVVSLVKQVEEKVDRCPTVGECRQGISPLTLPVEAGKGLVWNSTGDALEVTDFEITFSEVDGATVNSLANLKALTGMSDGAYCKTRYRSSESDGGGGDWFFSTNGGSGWAAEVALDTLSGIYVPPNSDPTGASGAWVRQYIGFIYPIWFGAAADGSTDDTDAVQAALTLGAVDLNRLSYSVTALTFPTGRKLYGNNGALYPSGEITLASNVSIYDTIFDGTNGGYLYGTSVNRVLLSRCTGRNGNDNGVLITDSTNIEILDGYYFSNTKNGIYFEDTDGIVVERCQLYSNGRSGVLVGSDSDGYNCSGVTLNNNLCYLNGTSGSYSGILVSRAEDVGINNNKCYSNQEHGISIQEISDFTISGNGSYVNLAAGICPQSGLSGTGYPVINGTISGNNIHGNDVGIAFKEECENIVCSGNRIYDNTSYQVRFVDIGSSGLYSTAVDLVGNMTITTMGANIVNSNGSRYCITDVVKNHTTTAYIPSRLLSQALDSVLTISTVGDNYTYPEIFHITNSGTDVARTLIGEAIANRKIILMADGSGAVDIRHDQGDAVTFAGFILSAAATTTLGAYESITFIGNGIDWIEVAKNY